MMKIVFYEVRNTDLLEDLIEINSHVLPHRGDRVNLQLEDGTRFTGTVFDRTYIVDENELSGVNIKCIGKRL